MNKHSSAKNGFTLIEIIAVLLILGILAAVVYSRWTSFDAEVYTGADALKTHLRYAQTQAMNRNPNTEANTKTVMGITYESNSNRYWLFNGIDKTNIELLPDDAQYTAADRKINLAEKKIKFNTGFTLYFDDHGIPYTSYTSSTSNAPLVNTLTINVSGLSGGQSVPVRVTPRTGFVP